MFSVNIYARYIVDRPLTDDERRRQIRQTDAMPVTPACARSVVKLNTHYLEIVDKFYAWKGLGAASLLAFYLLWLVIWGGMTLFDATPGTSGEPLWLIAQIGMPLPVLIPFLWLLRKKEWFGYTYHPIRFYRQTRTVHVFRQDGTVLIVPWDEIFFTWSYVLELECWEICGHVLAQDKSIVVETFGLSRTSSFVGPDDHRVFVPQYSKDKARALWELIRLYMEEGPGKTVGYVQHWMQIDTRHETYREGLERLADNGWPRFFRWLAWPFNVVRAALRWLALRSCKIPRWPGENPY